MNGVEQAAGFIIDWPSGVVPQIPHGLPHYDVSFYSGCQPSEFCRTGETSLGYVVSYDYDASRQQGFIYLPGMGDQAFRFGQVMWHGHGLERYWLRSASAWENFVRPVIAKAARASR